MSCEELRRTSKCRNDNAPLTRGDSTATGNLVVPREHCHAGVAGLKSFLSIRMQSHNRELIAS